MGIQFSFFLIVFSSLGLDMDLESLGLGLVTNSGYGVGFANNGYLFLAKTGNELHISCLRYKNRNEDKNKIKSTLQLGGGGYVGQGLAVVGMVWLKCPRLHTIHELAPVKQLSYAYFKPMASERRFGYRSARLVDDAHSG